MSISVIGAGRWGCFLAWYLAIHKKESVLLFNSDTPSFDLLMKTRKNDFLELSSSINFTTSLGDALKNEQIVVAINAQNFKDLSREMESFNIKNKTLILAMKGIDVDTKQRLSQIAPKGNSVAVLLGPGHVQDYVRGVYGCAVVDSHDKDVTHSVAKLFKSEIMRIFYGTDIIGNEICAAYKNVIGIVAGIMDGLGWQSLKGALMSRSILEIGNFVKHFGGKKETAGGLALLGDFEATLFSPYSNNRLYGEKFVKGEVLDKVCEGYFTLKAVYEMGKEAKLYLPITDCLYEIIYNKFDIETGIKKLFGIDEIDEF
jgi:glycerol-3-phosphate dehydrogenase (NAD(P)+)